MFFTLTISYLVRIFRFDPNTLRLFAVFIIGFLGLTLIIPRLTKILEGYLSLLSGMMGKQLNVKREGFLGGYITGFFLGLVWSPCAGPILATIATLAATTSVNFQVIMVTFSYVVGLGIPLFFFSFGSSVFFQKTRVLSPYTGQIQKAFGLIMILTAIAIYTNYDKILQVKLLDAIPSYSNFLYRLEGNDELQRQLSLLKNKKEEMKKEMPKINVSNGNLPNLGPAPEFIGITKWLNLPTGRESTTMRELHGKVVLIDFWTYTCINCVRTLPHVTGWYEKYKNKGLVVVGVHTPEFEFEKNTQNVLNAIKQHKINYPVAQDNDYATWNAYNNHYWPAKYLIDTRGNIRFIHFGEGQYEETEIVIKKLLNEAGKQVDDKTLNMGDQTPKISLTPETYLGTKRREGDRFKLEGNWDEEEEYISSHKGSSLELRFFSSRVFLVMTPQTKKDTVRIYLDGKLVKTLVLDVPRLYDLIDLHGKYGGHILRLEFETDGTKIFALTFG